MKRFRKPKLRDGELRAYWGKLPHDSPDVVFAWQGDPVMKHDARLLHLVFGCQKPDLHATPLFSKMNPSFIDELIARGYDITTLRFSIMKQAAPIVKE